MHRVGQRGFSAPAYALLKSNAGREAWLNAAVWDRFHGRRPELIVPLPSPSTARTIATLSGSTIIPVTWATQHRRGINLL